MDRRGRNQQDCAKLWAMS